MVQPISTAHGMIAEAQPRGRVATAIVSSVVLLAAAVLWFHYGTAVFFEMIAAGISACF
jgi:hypothetical protein